MKVSLFQQAPYRFMPAAFEERGLFIRRIGRVVEGAGVALT